MFGPFWPNELREQVARAGPATAVSRERFIELMIASGKSRRAARMQAKIAVIMGSEVLIGGKMWTIKREE
mgnify:FL=1